ncbi:MULTISPECIES: hypothetical protein [unclassified Rhizobium]|uniref:hypothetical protein n=1 Tax=unclassified Rhizobium TaxID=2613769 RepID=UPI001600B394|nr:MULTISPECIES: hypothetical protein [unclassified Rhizobium]MBB1250386.1 hypothetical protein [Rhizobium sp. G21]MCV3764893.1 hypothetical protein [Rhizobium sp. TRM95796]
MNAVEPAAAQYFQTVRAAFVGLEAYLDGPGRNQSSKDLTSTLVMKYVERLKTSLACWENKIGFMDRFRISRADSGFPVFQNVLELENDRRSAPEKLAAIPDAGRLRAEMVDFILRNKAFPEELQSRIAERLYLEEAQKGEVFSPVVLPETSAVSVNSENLRPSVVVNWAAFDGAQTLPMIYIARIEDSSENLTRMLVKPDGTLNDKVDIPFPVGGFLNPELAARFDDFVIRNSGYALTPVTIATNLDKDFPTLHPKQMRRIVIGPFYSAGITENNEVINSILSRVRKAENAWLLTWTVQDVISKQEKPAQRGFFSSTPAEQIFHIDTNDLEAARMGASAFEKHALVPHDAYTALYASGEAERVFAGYKVHVISGNQVTDV